MRGVFTIIAIVFFTIHLYSQPGGGGGGPCAGPNPPSWCSGCDGPNPPPQCGAVPIDSDIWVLILGGTVLGMVLIKQRKVANKL